MSLSLTHAPIRAGAPLGVTIRNANAFAISGSLGGRSHGVRLAAKRFAVAARGHTHVTLLLSRPLRARLARARQLSLVLTASVTDPARHTRRVRRTVTLRGAR